MLSDDLEESNSIDDVLDTLSPKQRAAVLAKLGIQEHYPKLKGMSRVVWDVIMIGSFLWLLLWSIITMAVICTIIFAPLLFIPWTIANTPILYFGEKRREARARIAEKNQ